MSGARGRVALVTGASRGIGAAIARRLAADGMAVAVGSHPDGEMLAGATEVAASIRRSRGNAIVCVADISDTSAVDAMFSRCEEQLGHVDALVLNAAATARVSWEEISESDWERIAAVNLKGAFLCCRRAFGTGGQSNGGGVVAISSVLARVGAPNSLHYATTKAGLIGFTRSLARELAPRAIRVNCVMPGAIRTEDELETFPEALEAERAVLANQMLKWRGQPDDIAGAVSFLIGPDGAFLTGQTICVDGGWAPL